MVTAFAFSRVSLVWVTGLQLVYRSHGSGGMFPVPTSCPLLEFLEFVLAMLTRTGHEYNAGRGVADFVSRSSHSTIHYMECNVIATLRPRLGAG